jgi:hypothetical protein
MLGNEFYQAKPEYRTKKTLYINCTFLIVYRICADEKGLRRPPNNKISNKICRFDCWASRQPFFVRAYSVHDEKCTVYVEGL